MGSAAWAESYFNTATIYLITKGTIQIVRILYAQSQRKGWFRISIKKYVISTRLREHMLVHAEGKISCPHCDQDSKIFTREALRNHIKR